MVNPYLGFDPGSIGFGMVVYHFVPVFIVLTAIGFLKAQVQLQDKITFFCHLPDIPQICPYTNKKGNWLLSCAGEIIPVDRHPKSYHQMNSCHFLRHTIARLLYRQAPAHSEQWFLSG